MTRAIAARFNGDVYQALWFWWNVCDLLDPHSHVLRVAYEATGVRAWDDVVVFYDGNVIVDGRPLTAKHFQVKFHVDFGGAITWRGLMDPAFINAKKVSLLQRLCDAQREHAPDGLGREFILFTPWGIHPDDPLTDAHAANDGRLLWDVLAQGKTLKSTTGEMRAAWRGHLGLASDDELRIVLRPLRIWRGMSLTELRVFLNPRLTHAGLVPIDEAKRTNAYETLPLKLLGDGCVELRRDDVIALCKEEGLWRGQPTMAASVCRIGVRTFVRWSEHLESETDHLLSLTQEFNGRRIIAPENWNRVIFPLLRSFLEGALRGQKRCRLYLHVHASLAFATGYCIGTKSGLDIEFEGCQSCVSAVANCPSPGGYPNWTVRDVSIPGGGREVAVALGVTHDVLTDVRTYVAREMPTIGRILVFELPGGPSDRSILDCEHAGRLANTFVTEVRARRTADEKRAPLHLFAAAPNTLLFAIGQRADALGPTTLYEFAFGSGVEGAYEPSLTCPPTA